MTRVRQRNLKQSLHIADGSLLTEHSHSDHSLWILVLALFSSYHSYKSYELFGGKFSVFGCESGSKCPFGYH